MGGPAGPLGGLGFIESLRSLRASVGLIVLAPNPEMCGTVDCLLLDVEEGVWVRWAGDFPGERAWLIGVEVGSGVNEEGVKCVACNLDGGWNDFALADRFAEFGSLGTPVVELRLEPSVSRRAPLFKEGERPSPSVVAASLVTSCRPSRLLVGSMPGPTLFRGARAAGFGGA